MKLDTKLGVIREGDLVEISDINDTCSGLKAVVVGEREAHWVCLLIDGAEDGDVPLAYLSSQLKRLFAIKVQLPRIALRKDGSKTMRLTDEHGDLNVSTADFGMDHLEALIPIFRDMAPKVFGQPATKYFLLAHIREDGNLGFDPDPIQDPGW